MDKHPAVSNMERQKRKKQISKRKGRKNCLLLKG